MCHKCEEKKLQAQIDAGKRLDYMFWAVFAGICVAIVVCGLSPLWS